jgi:uncharacterized NAD(P)/FAD-binding protein YdhS/predicted metal-dependent enzyme (double-stranded beta helix superfamily)
MSSTRLSPAMARLVADLDAAGKRLDEPTVRAALESCGLAWADVEPYVEINPQTYARKRVVRRETYELLVMTWSPGQASVPHDHAGSICGLRVFKGSLRETTFAPGNDGLVAPAESHELRLGGLTVDPGVVVHSLCNEPAARDLLVTVHVYAPPLPELRRYAQRPPGVEQPAACSRRPAEGAPRVAIVGGGFSGAMVAAHLVRRATREGRALALSLIDRQSSFAEGVAYRTNDPAHLLNVPAGRMSAWPDKPDDFFAWAKSKHPDAEAGDFLPRRWFGEYVRETLLAELRSAGPGVSIEILRDEAVSVRAEGEAAWTTVTRRGGEIPGDAVVLAVGHRPPTDPFGPRWSGTRARFIADPWSSLAISSIGPDEPVLVLGTGLTMVDVVLSLARNGRRAPIVAVSRRGHLPLAHAAGPVKPVDLSAALERGLIGGVNVRQLVRVLRDEAERVAAGGGDWRSVVDGVRPHTRRLWAEMPAVERSRFVRRVRPLWEIHRHRMAASVAATVGGMRERGLLRIIAGSIESVSAVDEGVVATVRHRPTGTPEAVHSMWVINCTGPSVDARAEPHPVVASLIRSGHLQPDQLGLGVVTGAAGRAVCERGTARDDLVVVGTLRKPAEWESTAVPELRVQAAEAAEVVYAAAMARATAPDPGRRTGVGAG